MNNSAVLWVVLAIIIIGGGLFWWMTANPSATDTSNGTATTTVVEGASSVAPGSDTGTNVDVGVNVGGSAASATVTYNGSSFSPNTVTIKKGGTVTFTSTAGNIWVASDEHPNHTEYDGTSRATHCAPGYTGEKPFDQCGGGTSYSFTFTKVGTTDYHNHLNASQVGKVVVTE